MSQDILDLFLSKICLFQSVRANQSSILVKYAPKECKKKDIRREKYLCIYKCQKQSTFHDKLTFICMYRAVREKWKAKQLLFDDLFLSFTSFIMTSQFSATIGRFSPLATQPIMGWHGFWNCIHMHCIQTTNSNTLLIPLRIILSEERNL